MPVVEYYDGQTSNGEKKKEEEKKRAVKRALDKPCTVPLLPFHHSRTSRIRRLDKLSGGEKASRTARRRRKKGVRNGRESGQEARIQL